jgi:hypothetical protein
LVGALEKKKKALNHIIYVILLSKKTTGGKQNGLIENGHSPFKIKLANLLETITLFYPSAMRYTIRNASYTIVWFSISIGP